MITPVNQPPSFLYLPFQRRDKALKDTNLFLQHHLNPQTPLFRTQSKILRKDQLRLQLVSAPARNAQEMQVVLRCRASVAFRDIRRYRHRRAIHLTDEAEPLAGRKRRRQQIRTLREGSGVRQWAIG